MAGAKVDRAARAASVHLEGVRYSYARAHAAGGDAPFSLAVDDLRLAPGECVACIGPSGSGKTTLVHLIAGILAADAGRIEVGAERIDALDEAARRAFRAREIGLVFQEFELLDYLDARDNVLVPYRLMGAVPRADWSAARARAEDLFRALGLAGKERRRPSELSQGERQRVAIARALVTEPAVILCDEPTGNLDPRTAATALDRLLGEARTRGAALLMVTHDHTLLERFDRTFDVRDLRAGPTEEAPA